MITEERVLRLDASNVDFRTLNREMRSTVCPVEILRCNGQRFIGAARKQGQITVYGTPGNGLAAYLDGGEITVYGNAQDAAADTMNGGKVVIYGSAGDALGYGMRGGEVYVRGNVGYRAGIHMKQYGAHYPVMVVGGSAGSFLGEYLAGGVLAVLGLWDDSPLCGHFTGTGMHGGKLFLRTAVPPKTLWEGLSVKPAAPTDLDCLRPYLEQFSQLFQVPMSQLENSPYLVIEPKTDYPSKQVYVIN